MRRLLILLLCLLLSIPTACAEGENTLLRYATALGRELDELAEDDSHALHYTTEPEVLELVRSYGSGDHDRPYEVRAVMLEEMQDTLSALLEGIPEAGRRQMENMLPGMLKQSSTNSFGVNAVVANAILFKSVTFASQDVAGQGLWILLYEDAVPVAVSWYAENGAVHMEASFIPDIDAAFETRVIAAARPQLDMYARSLAAELQELAGNEQYLMMLDISEDVVDVVHKFCAEGNKSPLVLCTLTDDAQAVNACLTQQIGKLGTAYLAAAGSLHASVIFADPDASGTGLYLFVYESGAPIIVSWTGENGAYYLSAAFQPGAFPAACRDMDDANEWAKYIGLDVRFQQPGAILLP